MTDKPEGLALLAEAGRWITYEEALRAQRLPVDDPYFEQLYCSCLASASVVLPGTSLYRARYMPPERATDTKPFAIEDMGPPLQRLQGTIASAGRASRAFMLPSTPIQQSLSFGYGNGHVYPWRCSQQLSHSTC